MIRRALLTALLLPACAEAPPAAPAAAPAPTDCAAHEGSFDALIGMTEAEVRSAMAAMPGIQAIRAGRPNAPMTSDYRGNRATLAIQHGRVARITCG